MNEAKVRAALKFYADEADALCRYLTDGRGKDSQAIMASVTVLALDAGRRAQEALEDVMVTCPYGQCTMRNLCKSHCVRKALERDGWERTEKGDIQRKETTDGNKT